MNKAKAIATLTAYLDNHVPKTDDGWKEAQDALDRLAVSPEANTTDDHYQANRRRKVNEMNDHFNLARDILTELQGHNMSTREQQSLSDCKGLLTRIWNITYFFTTSGGDALLHE